MNIIKNKNTYIVLLSLIFLSIPIFLTAQMKPIQMDDIMYASWSKGGILNFFEMQGWHYANFNGRFVVHFCLSLLTALGNWLYGIMPIVLAFSFYMILSTFTNLKLYQKCFLSSSTACIFFLLNKTLIVESVFWMSGGFNYLFPLLPLSITLYYLNKKDKIKPFLLFVLVLITSSTMEQYGAFLMCYIFLKMIIDKKNYVLNLLASVIGTLTILISPATINRILEKTSTTATAQLSPISSLTSQLMLLFHTDGMAILTIIMLTFLCLASIIVKDKYSKMYKYLIPAIIIAILAIIFNLQLINLLLLPTTIFLVSISSIKTKNTKQIGLFLLSGLAAFSVIIAFKVVCFRVAMPMVFTSLSVILICLYDILHQLSNYKSYQLFKSIVIFSLCVLSIISSVNLLINRLPATTITNEMYQQFKNKDTNEITVDIDKTGLLTDENQLYRYANVFDGCGFDTTKDIRQYFNLKSDFKINFASKQKDVMSVSIDGKYSYMPAIKEGDIIYIPLFALCTKYDNVEFYENSTIFIDNGCRYALDVENGELIIIEEETRNLLKSVKTETIRMAQKKNDTRYVELESFCEWLGLSYTINNDIVILNTK